MMLAEMCIRKEGEGGSRLSDAVTNKQSMYNPGCVSKEGQGKLDINSIPRFIMIDSRNR